MRWNWAVRVLALVAAGPLSAQEADKRLTLAAPKTLTESGLIDFLVPRFSLKTSIRITLAPEGAGADAVLGDEGVAAFEGLDQVWHLDVGADPDAQRFADWLMSDVGRGTVDQFAVDGTAVFSSSLTQLVEVAEVSYDGDAARGAELALERCGRCHVVSEENRMKAIGSTPSFAVLRTLPNWDGRFLAFYTLNPHPAFTQVAEVTPPFDQSRPSPIEPVRITLDELEDVLSFVAAMPPADLGAPVQSR
ncbi:hypothetical protein [Puniceibacterium sediminis]|uniref:Cytochrome c domain-containing protein n=1 Tax=Puniceibacterium sediminis TaxID=1608407 RepID=A0A238XVP0_9RHOB|nr:hypothetical protein [Puniceibacterium sediminis]SNR62059.1 hypothetical protein SAMN06265370_1137 [Puniceibacterium sediminis]